MIRFVLQNILFPTEDICREHELYFRNTGCVDQSEETIIFCKDASLDFDTYFNQFSIAKWKKCTHLKNLFLNLVMKGVFTISVIERKLSGNDLFDTMIEEYSFSSEKKEEISVTVESGDLSENTFIFFRIKALTDKSVFYSGCYFTEAGEIVRKDIFISLNICTYKREEYLRRNIMMLKERILDNQDSPLYSRLAVTIVDNGKTLSPEEFGYCDIKIFPNKNTGGAGGFSRGVTEIMKRNEITHIIFMDDDIVIDPEVLLRNFAFLSLLRDEYRSCCIPGGMLRIDKPSYQHELGASWKGKIISLGHYLDLCDRRILLENESHDVEIEYAAWWYACYPVSVFANNNLPLQSFFIHCDDVEFGLRSKLEYISLNGIAVWHEPFDNKYSSTNVYYDIRNLLIVNAMYGHCSSVFLLKRDILNDILWRVCRYCYKEVDLYFRGIEDFCKGVSWFISLDVELHHKGIVAAGEKLFDMQQVLKDQKWELWDAAEGKEYPFLVNALTLNGWLFPAKNDRIYAMRFGTDPHETYRKKKVLWFDPYSKRGFLAVKSFMALIKILFRLLKVYFIIDMKYKKSIKEFKKLYENILLSTSK